MSQTATAGDFATLDFWGSGPNGAFLAFADNRETLKRWVDEGFLHLHPGQRTPAHHIVCQCARYS